MAKEEEIQQYLTREFPALEGKIRTQRARRMWADIPIESFPKVLEFMKGRLDFTLLCTMTGLDKGETLAVIYHLARPDGIVLNAEINTPKSAPVIRSVTKSFPSADLYERELVDLLGIKVEGLAEGFRYPLMDDWPTDQHPLRKDWKAAPAVESDNNRKG